MKKPHQDPGDLRNQEQGSLIVASAFMFTHNDVDFATLHEVWILNVYIFQMWRAKVDVLCPILWGYRYIVYLHNADSQADCGKMQIKCAPPHL